MTATEKQLLVKLKSKNYPNIAEDGKGFFIIWADGRGQVGYKNKKHAIAFIEQGDRDAVSMQYRERQTGETVRNIFSLDKSSAVHSMLFKEAEDKKEHRNRIIIHEALFSDVEDREKILEEDERLEKEAMSQQSGGSNLKNSGWNTEWQFGDPTASIEKVKKQVSQKAVHYFNSLQGQVPFSTSNSSDLRPNPLSFLFHYFRTIIPGKDEESAGKARNAMAVLDGILPGFQQFQQDMESSNIPLNPYFMVSKFSGSDGNVDEPNLTQFISQEQGKQLALPDGTEVPSASHYQEHVRQGSVKKTDYVDKAQTFSMDEINTATASMLKYAVADRVKDGYVLKKTQMGATDTGPNLNSSLRDLLEQRIIDNGLDTDNNPIHAHQATLYQQHYYQMMKNIEDWQKDPSSIELTAFELRQMLLNMAPMFGSQPKTPPDQFRASVKTLYSANGWDSTSDDPNRHMLTLPPLRQLPRGEVVYDRGNGNMGYDHLVLNWKQGLSQLIQKWGAKCAEWLSILQGGQGMQEIAQQSPEVEAAWQNVISLQSGNRTGAEALLDLFKDYPTWNEFDRNHVQKSLASEIRSVNKLRQNPATSQSFGGGNLPQQIQVQVQQILQIGQSDPKAAHAQLTNLSAELVQYYMQGVMDWKNLTLALHALNTPVASAGLRYPDTDPETELPVINPKTGQPVQKRVSNGLTTHPAGRARTSIDEQGFGMLQQYGYQVAKMMDFLSATMYRSCHEQINTPYGQENRFGHQYSTSSGTSKGGDIILTVEFSQLDATATENQVDVHEQLNFSLGQKSGVNDEPILLRSSLPWEQMVQAFNEMYPEAGYEFQVVHDSISRDLNMLEQGVKEALNDTRGETKVVYHDSLGHEFVLSGLEIAIEEMANKEDAGETNLIDATQEAVIPTPSTQPEPATPGAEWSMGPEAFEPTPSATEVEEQVLPPAPTPAQTPVPQRPQQEMPKAKPMTDPMNLPISDPSARYIQKKDTKGRRLLRQNAGLGSIEERLQKAANKLDECSEFTVADKIDLLLQKMHEGKDVRETSQV